MFITLFYRLIATCFPHRRVLAGTELFCLFCISHCLIISSPKTAPRQISNLPSLAFYLRASSGFQSVHCGYNLVLLSDSPHSRLQGPGFVWRARERSQCPYITLSIPPLFDCGLQASSFVWLRICERTEMAEMQELCVWICDNWWRHFLQGLANKTIYIWMLKKTDTKAREIILGHIMVLL